MANILAVDDDRDLCTLLKTALERDGHTVETRTSGTQLTDTLCRWADCILLDVMMPGEDGFAACRRIRAETDAPILFLTARTDEPSVLMGLGLGADDYLTKPFDTRELLACINALLRRQGKQVDELVFGNTSLDLDTCTLVCGGKSVRLSAREFDVMRFLLQAQDRILSKEMILARVWGYDSNAVENHVEVYVGFLRKKLSAINSNVRIEAVRRLGYRLEVAEG